MTQPIASFSGIASGIQWRDMIDQIMLQERRPVARLESQLQQLQQRVAAWRSMQVSLTSVREALKPLADGPAFQLFSAAVTGVPQGEATPASVSATGSAVPGSYQLQVESVAQRARVGGAAFDSRFEALNLEGAISINGRDIEIGPGQTLSEIAATINAANSGSDATGVSASIMRTPLGNHRLVLTADRTGVDGIRFGDGTGGVLASLGLSSSSGTVAQSVSSAALTNSAGEPATAETSLADLGLQDGDTIRFNLTGHSGQKRELAFPVDHDAEPPQTLGTLAAALQDAYAAIGGGTVAVDNGRLVVTGPSGGESSLNLKIASDLGHEALNAGTTALDGYSNVLAAGRDAVLHIDGVRYQRAGNTFDDIIDGVTFTALRESATTVTANITRDTNATRAAAKALADTYNTFAEAARQQSQPGKPLSADASLRSMQGTLRTALSGSADVPAGDLSRLADVGIEIDRNGRYTFNAATFDAKLAADPAGVAAVFSDVAGEALAAAANFVNGPSGSVESIVSSLEAGTPRLTTRIENLEARLDRRKEEMIQRFTRMEQALSKAQSQSQWLTAQLAQFEPNRR